jgi:chaperonin GroES
MSLRATTDRIIVLPEESESVTATGIIIPEQARQTQTYGTVIAVGPNIKDIQEGDEVIFKEHGGASIEYEGTEHFSLHIGEVIAVVER